MFNSFRYGATAVADVLGGNGCRCLGRSPSEMLSAITNSTVSQSVTGAKHIKKTKKSKKENDMKKLFIRLFLLALDRRFAPTTI